MSEAAIASVPEAEAWPARERCLALLRQMLLVRRFEERAAECYQQGLIRGFLHLGIGQEAVAVGAVAALEPDDRIVAAYREHGQALARGVPAASVMAEMFGKATGCCRGRGGSMHLFDAARRLYGGNAIVAGGLPLACGLALADRIRGRPHVTACFFGDGAVAEGEFHESLNLAALWGLPVLFLCENNLYAMGTRLDRHQAMTDIHRKGDAYAMPHAVVDGMDVLAVEAAVRRAVEQVRGTGRPFLLEARTYRFRAHSMYDAELYRPREEVERWKQRDPLALFIARLQDDGRLDDAALAAVEAEVAAEIDAAVAAAQAAAVEPVADLLRDVVAPSGPEPQA
jgi:pyruvate dehydrogenase E1 component alpha subunit